MNQHLVNRPIGSTSKAVFSLLLATLSLILISPKWVMPVFAWIAPLALLYYTRCTVIRRKWLWLFIALVLAGLVAMHEVFPMPLVVSSIFALIGAGKALLVLFADKWISRYSQHFITTLFYPSFIVALEYLDAQGGGGVWGALANTQFGFSWLMQLASVTGIWGISFMIAWFGSVSIWAMSRKKQGASFVNGVRVYGICIMAALVFGAIRYHTVPKDGDNKLPLAGLSVATYQFLENLYEDYSGHKIAIQPKISQASPELQKVNQALVSFVENPDTSRFRKGFEAMYKMHDSLILLTKKLAARGAKIISWSEGNGFVLKQDENNLLKRGRELASASKVYLLMAMAVIEPGKITAGKKFIENKAILIGPDGTVLNVFHKNKPVPMVENSKPGDQLVPVIETPYGRISTSICYDADFPSLMRQLGKNKADLLLLPSGDWYAIDPVHSYMAVIRGIENGTPVFRQVSGGLSVASDYRGSIISSMDFFTEGEKSWIVEMPLGHVPTIYNVIGDTLAYLSIVLTAGFLAWLSIALILERRKQKTLSSMRALPA